MTKNKKEGFWETVKTVISAIVIALIIRTFAYEPFNIPSGSMLPTLLIGDYLFVSKYSYGYSRHSFPLSFIPLSGRFFEDNPERGDVAVFKLPRDNKTDYIKRIIGLPGDKIQMQNGRLYINNNIVEREPIEDFVYKNKYGIDIVVRQFVETLPGGRKYFILEEGDNRRFDNTRVYTVPEDHYFMMGDNRDNSEDSRSRVSYVPSENLVGRAEILFFSNNGEASFIEVWNWHNAIRFNRIFDSIN